MILDTTDTTETLGNVNNDDVTESKVSEAAMAHVTGLLRFLYNDPMSAVFREYVANALDAHMACGNTEPVNIYLPTYDTPVFTVTDNGTGMSPATLRKVFSQFGESTKRKSNTEIGGFGLGSKSGLAIASQLTIISTMDGVRSTAIYSNSQDGLAKLNIVDIRDSDEPNGTSVAVPVDNVEDFRSKAKTYFPFFEPNTVVDFETGLVENYRTKYKHNLALSLPVSQEDTTVHIFTQVEDTLLAPNRWSTVTGVYLVMGGIPYLIPEDTISKNLDGEVSQFIKLFSEDALMIIDAPIGAAKLSPSREGIQFNENTQDYFRNVFTTAITEFISTALVEIEGAETFMEAVTLTDKLPKGLLTSQKIEWNGISTKGMNRFSLRHRSTRYNIDYNDAIYSGTSTLVFNGDDPTVKVIYGTVSPETFRRYVGTYLREEDNVSIVRYIKHQTPKKGEEFDFEGFRDGLTFAPSAHNRNEGDWDYKEYGVDDNYSPSDQIITFAQVAEASELGEDFMEFISYDDMKKEVLAIRREKAKLAREANASPEEKAKLATKYLTLVAGEDETVGMSVSDIQDLDSIILVTRENVGFWREGTRLVDAQVKSFDRYATKELDAEVMGEIFKGKTFVFVTGSRSADHAIKLLKGPKIIQFDSDKYKAKMKKIAVKALDPKIARTDFLTKSLPAIGSAFTSSIRDPELRKVYEAVSGDSDMKAKAKWLTSLFNESSLSDEVSKHVIIHYADRYFGYSDSKERDEYFGLDRVISKYPLLAMRMGAEGYPKGHSEHLVKYINLIHSKNKAKLFTNLPKV